ncbi:MAG: response regulator, partial [Okeania sp. SIO2D1]|nr:response regulator [Okeania sp. SIO2D1]
IKFTTAGGITLRVWRGTHGENVPVEDADLPAAIKLNFQVEDTGAGVAPEELDSLFEAFVQTETGKQSQEGTGLGLAISRKFIQMMGGKIKVTSEEGRGTTFEFNVQVYEVDEAQVESAQPQRRVIALESNQPRYRILIVDDKPINRQLLIKLLTPIGFEVQEASNGQEAVTLTQQWNPRLVFMDMRMPIMDGYEATQQIKSSTAGQAIAIVALTASVLEEEKAIVLSAGCDDFLRKPFREEEIFNAISKHLGARYLYDQSDLACESKPTSESIRDNNSWRELPTQLVNDLQEALIEGDVESADQMITQISSYNSSLASSIRSHFDNFEFEAILQAITAVREVEV